jgi:glycine cleavage system P protein (glycine dehydrogenase) subunit 1
MRYLPLTAEDRQQMLARIGLRAIDELFLDIPAAGRAPQLPDGKSEPNVELQLTRMAAANVAAGSVPFFVGCGAYRHHIPASVDHLIQRSEFLTSYTPYQPEISQGTLQALFEFQTQVAMLTGMEVANASMYDGSTAAAEAVLMAHRITKRRKALLAGNLHPHYRATIETVSTMANHEVVALPPDPERGASPRNVDDATSCVVVQFPDFYGHLSDLEAIAAAAHAAGALLVVVVTEVVSLGLLQSPGQNGADIVAAEGQSLGNPLSFGGPYVGLFATRQKFVRQMPGRLVGATLDAEGRRSFVLTLSAREQHIRRERATSNICTSAGLCALAFTIHLTLLGEAGLVRLAQINHANAVDLAERLAAIPGVTVLNRAFFNEFTIRVSARAADVIERLAQRRVLGGVPVSRLEPERPDLDNLIVVAVTETANAADRSTFAEQLEQVLAQ